MDNSASGPFKKIAILGLGLMGTSFGKALGRDYEISTYDPTGASLEGMKPFASATEAVEGADLVVLACPVGAFETLIKEIAKELKPRALLMDLGSVKALLEPIMAAYLPKTKAIQWVGGHPMCGSEKSGAAHGQKEMFKGATFFLTKGSELEPETQRELENLIGKIGSTPEWVDPKVHDQMVAQTSHLPHLSAALLMSVVGDSHQPLEAFRPYIAGGFKDMTRIAQGNEQVWKDILLYNQENLLSALETYEKQLAKVKDLLIQKDAKGLETFLTQAKTKRIDLIL